MTEMMTAIPRAFILMPDADTGPIALLLSEEQPGGQHVTSVLDAGWLLTNLASIDGEGEGEITLLPPEDVTLPVVFDDWPQEWSEDDMAISVLLAMCRMTDHGASFAEACERVAQTANIALMMALVAANEAREAAEQN